jgi:hypothetical protein
MDSKHILPAAALALSGLVAAPAEAQDFGIGTGLTLGGNVGSLGGAAGGLPLPGPLVGLEGAYWLNDALALDFYTNLGVIVPDGGDARFDMALAVGILYALAQGDSTKLELGVRAGVIGIINATTAPGADDEDADLFLDVLLRVEHWFDNHFALNGQVGINFRGDPDGNPGFSMLLGAQAGLGVMYYFDGNARPGSGTAAPAAPSRRSGGSGGRSSDAGSEEPPPDPESGAAGW